VTRNKAENGPSNAGSPAGPKSHEQLDHFARRNAQLLPPRPAVSETRRHAYPPVPPPQQALPQPVFKPSVKANRPKWKQ
jgi:hypothetical protein